MKVEYTMHTLRIWKPIRHSTETARRAQVHIWKPIRHATETARRAQVHVWKPIRHSTETARKSHIWKYIRYSTETARRFHYCYTMLTWFSELWCECNNKDLTFDCYLCMLSRTAVINLYTVISAGEQTWCLLFRTTTVLLLAASGCHPRTCRSPQTRWEDLS